MSIGRKEAIAVSVGVLLLIAAFVVPNLHLGIVTPIIKMKPADLKAFADAAPIFGWWNAHVGWGTVPAILIGAAAVVWGTSVAQRLGFTIRDHSLIMYGHCRRTNCAYRKKGKTS